MLNPEGCLIWEEIRQRVERHGAPLLIAAELHNPGLQLPLIAGGMGVSISPTSFVRAHALRSRVSVIRHLDFHLSIRVVFLYARHLGSSGEGRNRAITNPEEQLSAKRPRKRQEVRVSSLRLHHIPSAWIGRPTPVHDLRRAITGWPPAHLGALVQAGFLIR